MRISSNPWGWLQHANFNQSWFPSHLHVLIGSLNPKHKQTSQLTLDMAISRKTNVLNCGNNCNRRITINLLIITIYGMLFKTIIMIKRMKITRKVGIAT